MGASGLLYARYRDFKPSGPIWDLVGVVSRRTWFIFLFQSVWYYAGANSVFGFFPTPVAAVLFLCICVSAGCIFGLEWEKLFSKKGCDGDAVRHK